MIETRKTEERYITSDPKKMLNMYLASRVLRKWTEDFVDEDTGEVVSIERNEVLFDRGKLIDQDLLAQIRFNIEAGDIKEVEVSNQRREAFCLENNFPYPFIAQVEIGDKKHKFLFYTCSVESGIALLKDYVELNYIGGFNILMIKQFDSCTILTDSLKEFKVDPLVDIANRMNELFEEENNEDFKSEENENDSKPVQKKFYQIECRITYGKDGEASQSLQTFVVHTYNVDRAMMLINNYLKKQQDKREKKAIERGHKYEKYEIHAMVESAKPIPVGCFIPKEFSEAYID